MKIEGKVVVGFYYVMKDSMGNELERCTEGEPQVYLHGANNIMPKIEAGLSGLQVGDKVTLELAANDAYGNRDENAIQRLAVKYLKPLQGKLKAGTIAQIDTKEGPRQVTVLKMGKFQATIDANHPLAGQDLIFEIDVTHVREASADELAHGHAHGLDGSHSH